jgi:hypothetical protein
MVAGAKVVKNFNIDEFLTEKSSLLSGKGCNFATR